MYKVEYTTKAMEGLRKLFKQPFVTIEQVAEICKVTYKSASELVKQMCADKILEEVTKRNRNRLFVFGSYLSIFDKR